MQFTMYSSILLMHIIVIIIIKIAIIIIIIIIIGITTVIVIHNNSRMELKTNAYYSFCMLIVFTAAIKLYYLQ